MLAPITYKTQPTFNANLASPKLNLARNDFFIKIKGYGENNAWADEIISVTDSAVRMIRKNADVEKVLQAITLGVCEANRDLGDPAKRIKTGILRTMRIGWFGGDEKEIFTQYQRGQYSVYKDRFDKVAEKPLKNINDNIGMSRPYMLLDINHGKPALINNALDYVFSLFKKNIPQYINGELTAENLDKINDTVAEIRWVLAHATPWLRGSDAISNVFMRAIYKAVGVKAYPPAEGISYDLEAYCTELEDYKKKFPTYFEKAPEVVE